MKKLLGLIFIVSSFSAMLQAAAAIDSLYTEFQHLNNFRVELVGKIAFGKTRSKAYRRALDHKHAFTEFVELAKESEQPKELRATIEELKKTIKSDLRSQLEVIQLKNGELEKTFQAKASAKNAKPTTQAVARLVKAKKKHNDALLKPVMDLAEFVVEYISLLDAAEQKNLHWVCEEINGALRVLNGTADEFEIWDGSLEGLEYLIDKALQD